MLSSAKIQDLFTQLNDALKEENELGEIGIVGGAVMCLVFKTRESTKDIDAIFEPVKTIRNHARRIGEKNGLGPDWLNDSVKGFLSPNFKRNIFIELSNLRIWAPEPQYMLAMKCISARWDTHDRDDVTFLIEFLNLKKPIDVFKIIEGFYPKNRILPKTKFFIEEILGK